MLIFVVHFPEHVNFTFAYVALDIAAFQTRADIILETLVPDTFPTGVLGLLQCGLEGALHRGTLATLELLYPRLRESAS